VNIFAYGFIPYLLMGISNFLLINSILFCREASKRQGYRTTEKSKSIIKTVLIITTIFLIVTIPDNLLNAFFVPNLVDKNYGYVLIFFCDGLVFTYHGLSFLMLFFTNKRFANEYKACFLTFRKKNRVGITNDIFNRADVTHLRILSLRRTY
jgi:hypothetical protein